jgi:hypothetical protein
MNCLFGASHVYTVYTLATSAFLAKFLSTLGCRVSLRICVDYWKLNNLA